MKTRITLPYCRFLKRFLASLLVVILIPDFCLAQGWQHLLMQDTGNYFSLKQKVNDYFELNDSLRTKDESGYIHFARWTWFWDDRIDENGSYETAIQKMYEHNENLLKTGLPDENPDFMSAWTCLGPDTNNHPTGSWMGLVQSLWIDTTDFQKMYAGSNTGGIFITLNEGENWSPLMDSIGGVGINEIIVHPGTPDEIFVSTGIRSLGDHYGYGVMKSTDGGMTWENTGLNPSNTHKTVVITRLLEHPDSAYCMYALGNKFVNLETYIYKTYDGFQSFDTVFSSEHNELFDIEFKPGSPETIYVSGTQFLRSSDYGNTWDTLTDKLDLSTNEFISRAEIATTETSPDLLMVLAETIDTTDANTPVFNRRLYRSSDCGDNFTEIFNTGVNEPYFGVSYWCMEMKISPQDTNIIYLGGFRVYKYEISDTIATYINLNFSYHYDIRDLHLFSGGYDDIIYIGNDGGVTKSMNGGDDWMDLSRDGLKISQYYKFGMGDRLPLIIGGTQDGNKNQYDFTTDLWVHIFGDGGEMIFDYEDPDIIYASLFAPYWLKKSIDGGASFNFVLEYEDLDQYYSNVNPFIINPLNHKTLYLGLHDVYKTTDGCDSWDTISDFSSQLHAIYDQTLRSIGISRADTSVVYAGYRNPIWNQSTPDTIRLMRTVNGGEDWEDITDHDLYQWIGISDIEVSPRDASRFWVAMTRHEPNMRVYQYDQYGDTIKNISTGLPDLPVNCLKYYEESQIDALFAGTDAGVYYWNDTLDSWISCNEGMPLSMVTDLEINYRTNKIVASTFGRGMWEAGFSCDDNTITHITHNTVWDTIMHICNDIVIDSGGILTITSDVYMLEPNIKITVETGGKLVVDGGCIQSGSYDLWHGIEVQGNPGLEQNPMNQGMVVITNQGTVMDACVAIYAGEMDTSVNHVSMNDGGGIVIAWNAIFKNNNYGIVFDPFDDHNISFIKNSTFTNDYNSGNYAVLEQFIRFTGTKGIRIKGSTFENNNPDQGVKNGTGIYSFDSQIYIEENVSGSYPNLDTTYCSFKNLEYGIKALATTPTKNITIDSSEFSYNKCGIYLGGISYATIRRNTFNINSICNTLYSADTTSGLYLNACDAYEVEENDFYGVYNSNSEPPWKGIGVVINNSGAETNEIYNNYFEDCFAGIIAQNNNRDESGDYGLEIKCNDFVNCEYDIAITVESTGPEMGIKEVQGSPVASPTAPAGNTFTVDSIGPENNYYNQPDNNIEYWIHTFTIGPKIIPEHRSSSVDTASNYQNPQTYSKEYSCPSSFGSQGGGIEEEKSKMMEVEQKADSIQNLLALLIDGGNTEELNLEIQTSWPDEANELYNELMNDSPYLSDTVMISTVKKEDVLPSAMVTDILSVNPQAAKSKDVMQAVDARVNQLSEEQLAEINEGLFITGAKESLEAKLSYYKAEKVYAFNNIIRYFRHDTISVSPTDSIILLLENENRLEAKYALAFEYLALEDSSNTLSTLNSIPDFFDLSPSQLEQYQNYTIYFDLWLSLLAQNKNIYEIDSIQTDSLYQLLGECSGRIKAYVRNILQSIDTLSYHEPYIFPDVGTKSAWIIKQPVRKKQGENYLKLYPNPAGDYVITEYKLLELTQNASINIYNIEGKQLKSILLEKPFDYLIMDTRDLKNGVYIFSLIIDKRVNDSKRLIINR
jgi:hypothetical protein